MPRGRTAVTTHRTAPTALTRAIFQSSLKTWVMPSLVHRTPLIVLVIAVRSSELDLDVDAGRQVQPHQRVDGLRRGIDDVDQALVRAHLEVLARVLVLVRRPDDA